MIPRDDIDTSPERVAALEAEVRELRRRLNNELMIDRQVEAVLQAASRPRLRVVRA